MSGLIKIPDELLSATTEAPSIDDDAILEEIDTSTYRSYKYRLYPFKDQERKLYNRFDALTYLWNYALDERIDAWRKDKKSISCLNQQRSLTKWRRFDRKGLGRVHSLPAQDCLRRLDKSFQRFFKHTSKYPRHKKETTSMTYLQLYMGRAPIVDGRGGTKRLHLWMIGDIPIKIHRKLPEGDIKTMNIKREGDRWFVIFVMEIPTPAPATGMPNNPIGVDLGLHHLAVTSNNEVVDPPKFLIKSEKHIKHAQRIVSRRKKGSHNREKAKLKLTKLDAKVRNQRLDFAHKTTTEWANKYDLISFEDMDLRNHMQGRFSKSTADAGWGSLRILSEYKQQDRSHRYIEVETKNTTQTCSECNRLHEPRLTLNDRTYECPCGLRLDRDLNAATNILHRAIDKLGQVMPESTPVEIEPPPSLAGWRVQSLNQEPPMVAKPLGNLPYASEGRG